MLTRIALDCSGPHTVCSTRVKAIGELFGE